MALDCRTPIDSNHRSGNEPIMNNDGIDINDIETRNFESEKVASVLLSLINFDNKF